MFHSARLKLTIWYILITGFISLIFSSIIFYSVSREVERFDLEQRIRFERQLRNLALRPGFNHMSPQPIVVPDPDLVSQTKRRLFLVLLGVNALVISGSGFIGYSLTNLTLRPIHLMVQDQKRFISDASHELKTPITSLKTAFEVYLKQSHPKSSETRTLITQSLEETDRLSSIVDSLLQINTGYLKNSKLSQVTDLHKSFQIAIKRVKALANAKKIKINGFVTTSQLLIDQENLVRIIVILLDNAIKYSSPSTSITVKHKQVDAMSLLTFQDHGIGIDKKDLPHIFKRFYRADTSRGNNATKGHGLGLSIASQLATAHSGTISVTSSPGNGSIFTLSLPIASHK